ncbi:RlmE/FtsJ family methyltransferase [Candidatus Vidania fulgoroideorum]
MTYLSRLRSISFFKLKEIDLRFNLIKDLDTILEIGCFPGGWTQYILSNYKDLKLISIDKKQINSFRSNDFYFIKGDIFDANIISIIRKVVKSNFNLIISDACINISGINAVDTINYILLIKRILLISKVFLIKGGNLLFKIMLGGLEYKIKQMFRPFLKIDFIRLACTKNRSSEVFVYCRFLRF